MKTRTIGRSLGAKIASVAGGKIGMTKIGDPAIAKAPPPSEEVGTGSNRTQVYTYITKVPMPGQATPTIYNGDRLWARVTLTLENAGPVAVGQSSNLGGINSGIGQLLETDVPMPFTIAKGTKLYVLATAVNRIKVTVEPLPWLEQITALLTNKLDAMIDAINRTVGRKV